MVSKPYNILINNENNSFVKELFLRRLLPIFVFVLLLANNLFGEEIKFSASVSKNEVNIGERVTLTYSINSKSGNFSPPRFNNFTILSGPEIKKYGDNNGAYIYILQANKAGDAIWGPATIQSSGRTYVSNSVKIKVEAPKNKPQEPVRIKTQGQTQNSEIKRRSDIFLITKISKDRAYLGEPIIVEYWIYVNQELELTDLKPISNPNFSNLWAEEDSLGTLFYQAAPDAGADFKKSILRRYAVVANEVGEFDIPIMSFDFQANKSFLSDASSRLETKQASGTIETQAGKLSFVNLPKPPPAFTGGVGVFGIKRTFIDDKIYENRPFTVKFELSGRGNINFINDLELNLPPGFSVANVKKEFSSKFLNGELTGSKTFIYTVLAKTVGNYTFDPVNFIYFNPVSKNYCNASVEQTFISVLAADEKPHTSGKSFFNSDLLRTVGYILLLSGLVLFVIWLTSVIKKKPQPYIPNKVSNIEEAEYTLIVEDDEDILNLVPKDDLEFYKELSAKFNDFLLIKFKLVNNELSKERLPIILKNKNVSDNNIFEIISLLDDLNKINYAGAIQYYQSRIVYNRVKSLIKQL